MSVALDQRIAETGTRFLIYPQPRYLHKDNGAPLFPEPEVVVVSVAPEDAQAGPADARMYVVDAKNKSIYGPGTGSPPYHGPAEPPVQPGEDGHFTHLDPDTRAFKSATMYATVRRVLDIWEDYFGHPIPWHFEASLARLEMIPLVEWNNAHSGFGFLEFGYGRTPTGTIDHDRPYCENFDVLAHELGHSIIFSQVARCPPAAGRRGDRLQRLPGVVRGSHRHHGPPPLRLLRRLPARRDLGQSPHRQRARSRG